MRTTLTLDDDVAAALEQLRGSRKGSLKQLVNEALREGLKAMQAPPKRRKPFRTKSVDPGPPLIPWSDCTGELLARIEGENYRDTG